MIGGLINTDGETMELLRSPKKNPVVLKSYFVLDTEDGLNNDFKRHAYQQLGKSNVTTIIHYIGDETVAVAFIVSYRLTYLSMKS